MAPPPPKRLLETQDSRLQLKTRPPPQRIALTSRSHPSFLTRSSTHLPAQPSSLATCRYSSPPPTVRNRSCPTVSATALSRKVYLNTQTLSAGYRRASGASRVVAPHHCSTRYSAVDSIAATGYCLCCCSAQRLQCADYRSSSQCRCQSRLAHPPSPARQRTEAQTYPAWYG